MGAAATLAGAAYAASGLRPGGSGATTTPTARPISSSRSTRSGACRAHDGGSIHVVSRGEGPPIVLSHGVTLSVRTWVKQMESLPAAGFRTIAFDHRGHGDSTVGSPGHTLDTLADDVRTVVEGLDLRDAVLVGHSMGGIAVQLFCLRHPDVAAERVAGIVLLSTLSRTAVSGNPRLLSAHRLGRAGDPGRRAACSGSRTSVSSSPASASVASRSRATSSSPGR